MAQKPMRKQVITVEIDMFTGKVTGDILEGSPGGALCEKEMKKVMDGLSADDVQVQKKTEYYNVKTTHTVTATAKN